MKKLISLFAIIFLGLILAGNATAFLGTLAETNETNTNIEPLIFKCGNITNLNDSLNLRENKYAFEGEELKWKVLVVDFNGIDKIKGVYEILKEVSNGGYIRDSEYNCTPSNETAILDSCNIEGFNSTMNFNSDYMKYYDCSLSIKSPDAMYGQFNITTKIEDSHGNIIFMPEQERWFLNPVLSMSLILEPSFGDIISTSQSKAYSKEMLIRNDVDSESWVILSASISGNDLYERIKKQIKCINSDSSINVSYFARKGYLISNDDNPEHLKLLNENFSTKYDPRADSEGYVPLLRDKELIIKNNNPEANLLHDYLFFEYPREYISIKFRLDIPQGCYGFIRTNRGELIQGSQGDITFTGTEIVNPNINVSQGVQIFANVRLPCSSNSDCFLNDPYSYEECINPGTPDSYCKHTPLACLKDSDCGFTGIVKDNFCDQNNVFKIFQISKCINPGTISSYCSVTNETVNVNNCTDFCLNGTCHNFACTKDSDCDDNDNKSFDSCISPGTPGSYCEHKFFSRNPLVFECGNWSNLNSSLDYSKRIGTYFFEGEKIPWKVLVYDPRGIDKLKYVYITIGDSPGAGNHILENCKINENINFNSCDLREFNNDLVKFDPKFMNYYDCTITVQPPEYLYGLYWTTVGVVDLDGSYGIIPGRFYSFYNPVLAIDVNENPVFNSVVSGSKSYSQDIRLMNTGDPWNENALIMNFSISSEILYNQIEKQIDCPTNNSIVISYYARNGNFSTINDLRADTEGYVPLGINNQPIIENDNYMYNSLYRGQDMSINFKINVPRGCFGNLSDGRIDIFAYDLIDPSKKYNVSKSLFIDIDKINPGCSSNSDCNDNNNRTSDSCINPGTIDSYCNHENISCFVDNECGFSDFINEPYCLDNNVNQNYLQFKCLNPGTSQSYCKNETLPKLIETCKFGCQNNECIKDTTPPEAIIKFDTNKNDISVTGIDDLDKDVSVNLKENCLNLGIIKNCNREYTLSDNSNNNLVMKLNYKKYPNTHFTYKIQSLKYNNEKEISQKSNSFDINLLKSNKIIQNINFRNFDVNSQYNIAKKNKTVIRIFEKKKPIVYTKDGLSLAGLKTNKGSTNYIL